MRTRFCSRHFWNVECVTTLAHPLHSNKVTEIIWFQGASSSSSAWTALHSSAQLYELLLSLRRSNEAGLLSVSSTSLSHCRCRKASLQLSALFTSKSTWLCLMKLVLQIWIISFEHVPNFNSDVTLLKQSLLFLWLHPRINIFYSHLL